MFGRGAVRSVGALALFAAAAAPAVANEPQHAPSLDADKALIEVKIPSVALYDRLFTSFDFAHATQRNGDGSVSTDVLANAEERALLRARGVEVVRTLESHQDTLAGNSAREAARAEEVRARTLAETGADRAKAKGAIPLPGEVVIQRAYTFTNYAGRFLYV